MNELNNEKYIKALFIDYLFKTIKPQDVIGSEIMFGSRKGIADLIFLSEGLTIAYEIKAQNDDFRKMKYQLQDYNKSFDYVYLITTENHFSKAKIDVPDNNGIILIYNDYSIKVLRKSKQNFNLSSDELLSTMTMKFILKKFALSYNKLNSVQLRESLKNSDQTLLRKFVYEFFISKNSPKI